MARRRNLSKPWARPALGAIALLGTLLTGYLTALKLTGGEALCPTAGCNTVLNSSYAEAFGLPLALFGCIAYVSLGALAVAPLALRGDTPERLESDWEEKTWPLLFLLSTGMALFSGYLVYVLLTQLQAVCLYCWASAFFALALWLIVLLGNTWEDIGGLFFNGTLVGFGVLLLALSLNSPGLANQPPAEPPVISQSSSPAALALAQHLQDSGAVMYGAYWCPHCQDQKKLFGAEGATALPYVECDASGPNAQPQKCRDAGIDGFPTWKMGDQTLSGTQSLEDLAEASGYAGARNF